MATPWWFMKVILEKQAEAYERGRQDGARDAIAEREYIEAEPWSGAPVPVDTPNPYTLTIEAHEAEIAARTVDKYGKPKETHA